MKQISAITFFITVFFSLNAQFSLQGEVQKYYYAQEPNELTQIDTSLTDFEEYNFEYTDDWEYFNTSILGTAQQPLSFKWNRKKGFQDGNIFFNNYKYDIDNLRYFETEKFPYSEIFYSIGTKLEQKAGLVHAQNIKNRFKRKNKNSKRNSKKNYKISTINKQSMLAGAIIANFYIIA